MDEEIRPDVEAEGAEDIDLDVELEIEGEEVEEAGEAEGDVEEGAVDL